MIGVCTRYEEHLSIGSRITRDVIAEQQRTDLIYQRCVPRSKHFPPAYCHYTRIIGNEQQEHDSWCSLSKPCKSKANPKPSRDLLSIKASSTRIMIDQSHKGFGNYNSRSPYNPMNKRGLYPHEAKRSVVNHGDEISGKGWIPCCPPTCSGAEGRWGLRCRLSLVSTRMDLKNSSLQSLPPGCSLFDGGFEIFIGRYGRWFW